MTLNKLAASEYLDGCQKQPGTSRMTSVHLQIHPNSPPPYSCLKIGNCFCKPHGRASPYSECLLIDTTPPVLTHLLVLLFTYFTGICLIFPARQGSLRGRALSCASLRFPPTQCFEHGRQFNSTCVELSRFSIS